MDTTGVVSRGVRSVSLSSCTVLRRETDTVEAAEIVATVGSSPC